MKETSTMTERGEFLLALEACEQASALLVLGLESGHPDPIELVIRRRDLAERLSMCIPRELRQEDTDRLERILKVGDQARLRVFTERTSATSNLAAVERGLLLCRQWAPTWLGSNEAIQLRA